MLNAGKIKVPADYPFPQNLSNKTRDWKLSWLLLQEFGVATIPASGKLQVLVPLYPNLCGISPQV